MRKANTLIPAILAFAVLLGAGFGCGGSGSVVEADGDVILDGDTAVDSDSDSERANDVVDGDKEEPSADGDTSAEDNDAAAESETNTPDGDEATESEAVSEDVREDGDTTDADTTDNDTTDNDTADNDTSDADTESAVTLAKFSFFVTSLKALRQLSGNQNGFGGDLRYGETGAGAGLRGADKICTTIAEKSMPGSGAKVWRAFLSAANDGTGNVVNAIDRIGNGPWYDRLGRVFATGKAALIATRPGGCDTDICNDFPNEDGVTNHNPDLTGNVDNHDMLTGSNTQGKLYSTTATCNSWTSTAKTADGKPRVGHSWPRSGAGPGGKAGPGGDDMNNWISALTEAGCAAGINLIDNGAGDPSAGTVGAGGGYGGFYCFALTP